MGRSATLLVAVLLIGAAPAVGELADAATVDAEVETGVAGVHVATDGLRGNATLDPHPGNATEANDSARANATAGDVHVEVQADVTSGEVNVSTLPVDVSVRLADGRIVELTYTPPDADDVLDTLETESTVPNEDDPEPQPDSQTPAANADDDGDTSWTIAPAAGLAAAATAAASATPLTRWLRRTLGLAPTVPMFSRISREDVLDHPSREAIYELLDERGGLSLEAICNELELARSTARHHVRKLEQANVIEHTRLGRARVHHLIGERHRAVREHLLTNDTRQAVYEAVEDEDATISEVARRIDANPGSVHFHLGKLEDVGLVETVDEKGRRYRARELEEDALAAV